jgi:glutamate racemase
MNKRKPIGIFDSGLGGLSSGHAIKAISPEEVIVYYADLGYSPYGPKSKQVIAERSERIVQFLIEQDCKLIVVACNTATVTSIEALRAQFSIPIVGVEPGIKPAAMQSLQGVIGVLATEQTLNSDSFQLLKSKYTTHVRIEQIACPDFVSIVEKLEHEGDSAVLSAEKYIKPLLAAGCDQIVLGCTHFSFLKPVITKIVGQQVNIIDTAEAVAKQVQRKLDELDLRTEASTEGKTLFWTSGDSVATSTSISVLWGQEVNVTYSRP